MKSALLKTPLYPFASFLIYFNVLNTTPLQAQNGCEFIQFNAPLVGTCHYRLIVTNSSTCYPFIRLLFFDTGTFENWNVASGWTAEEISPTEILLTHSSGHVPTGASTPVDFYVPNGLSPVLDIQWEDSCPPGKGCFTEIQLDPCIIPSDACISGVNYVDVGCTQATYSDQPKLSGRTVTLLDAFGNSLQTTTTSTTGAYSFCNLPPGNYIVRITNPADWTASLPASGQYAVSLAASQTLTRNFGSCRANCLCSSINTVISPVSAGPNQCCYSLSTQLGGGGQYCFQYIHVQVDAGQSIVPGNAQTGWTMTANGNQEVQITPPGGYIPSNTTMAGTFCVSGSNPHSILTIVGHNGTVGTHECTSIAMLNCYYADPCPIDKPRIAYTPGPEYSFSGEVDLNPDVSIVSAVWDFGDGTRDSSCCLSTVGHAFEPGVYNTCLTITSANDQGETCTDSSCVQVLVGDPCDEVGAALQFHPSGTDCCYDLNISNSEPGFFTGINITLSSGNFVNSTFAPGWNISLNGNTVSLTPSGGGFLPTGTSIPVTICNPGGTGPYTVTVLFVYNGEACSVPLSMSACPCCSQNAAAFAQTVHDETSVVVDHANCKATLQIGNLPCQRVDWIDWGDQSISTGPFFSGAMPMHAYTHGVFYTISYQVSEINPLTGAVCYQQTFTKAIVLDCNCSCGSYDLEIRFGGAQNQPVVCGQTIPLSVHQNVYLYSNFQCQGTHCAPSTLVTWSLTGPGSTSLGGSDLAIPAFSVSALTPGNFTTPGLYTLDMYAICGLQDTCRCYLYFDVVDPCCGGGPSDPDPISTEFVSVTPSDEACSVHFDIGALPECYFVDSIQWGDGTMSVGPFGADTSIVHVYEIEDTYAVTFDLVKSAPGATGPCLRKSYTRAVNPVCLIACPCTGINNLVLTPGPAGPPLNVQCGSDVGLPCLPGGYTLTGNVPCACPGVTALITWELYGPQGLVDAGSVLGTPAFSISLPSGYFYVPGTYSLVLTGQCTTQIQCPCVIYFVITQPCPPLCPCDFVDFSADVAAGFTYTHSFLNCVYCFKGPALGPCDMVQWKIDNNPYSAPIVGTQSYCFNFTTGGLHTIKMLVTRKKGVNLICEILEFTQNISVNCLPLVVTNPIPVSSTPRQYIPGTGIPPRPLTPAVPAERSRTEQSLAIRPVLRVIPNPNTGVFVAEISEPAPANTQYRIVSLTGQVWQTGIIPEGARQQNVEAGDLPNGLYFLQLLVNGQVLTVGKLIKQ